METASLEIKESIDETKRTVVVSMNPNSGSTDRSEVVKSLVRKLEASGLEVCLLTDIDEVKMTVSKLTGNNDQSLRAVVAAGGDGTVSLLANCLPPQTPIAIMPMGTENLLAKYLGLTADPDHIAKMIVDGQTVRLDAGRANGQLFLVMASCGFDADVVHRLHSERKGHIRHWSYAKPMIDAISEYRYPKLRVRTGEADGDFSSLNASKPISAKWVFVFNVPRYAMNLPIVPDADPADGQLDLCTFRGGNLFRGILYLFAVLVRQHRKWRYSHIERFTKIRIEADEDSGGPIPFQLDGDPGGILPLEIEVIPKFLRVLVPKN